MPAKNCFPLPEGMSAIEGAMLEPLGIAIHSVDLGHLKAGQTVAVLGAGPVGLLIAAAAKAAGASEVYVTEPLAYRRQFALDYVADAAFDPDSQDVVAKVLQMTNGRGVDVAFEAAEGFCHADFNHALAASSGKAQLNLHGFIALQ